MGDETYEAVERILAAGDASRYAEADELLDRARADVHTVFRDERFRYALSRARLAARRGRRDEAAAFAHGALWQLQEDETGPQLPYHPGVGRVRRARRALEELRRYAAEGDAERYDALVDDYRSPAGGHVQWHWSLIERLRPNPRIPGRHQPEVDAARRAAEPLLMELRAAGVAAYDLADVSRHKLPSKRAAEILVKWLQRIEDPLARTLIATALTDPKARAVAAQPLLDLFRALPEDAREKDRVAAALGTLARDYGPLAELVRDPRHGRHRLYLFDAIARLKDPRAVDLCLEFVDDDQLGLAAVRALANLKSERARPALERIAREPTTRGRGDAAQRGRDRVRTAEKGLQRLDRRV